MTITVNVSATGAAGTTATNALSVVTNNVAGPTAGPTASTTIENADLVVTKSHVGVTTPGGALTYTITINNLGPSAATGVTLNDTAPANITFGAITVASVPAGISSCAPAPTATTIACAGWNIPSGTVVTVTVPATLSASAVGGTTISNTASTTSGTLDSNAANNSATDAFVVGAASIDLGVTLAVAPNPAAPGDTVTYTVTVTNPSLTTDATNVVVTDILPAGLTPVTPPATPTVGAAVVAGQTWTWTIPTLAKGASGPTTVTATFDAVVDPSTVLTTITDTATVTATQTDPTPANNTATVDLAIAPAVADLNVITAVDNSKPKKGDTIAIAIQISNAGPNDATNVVVKDVMPTGLKFQSCTGCSASGLRRRTFSGNFSVGSIPANGAATIILNATVQASSGTLKNTASILSADQTDPVANNDKDTLQITVGGTNNSGGGGGGGSGGGTSGSGGTSSGSSGSGSTSTTAFTGFTAGQLMPWFLLLFSLGLVAIELARRKTLVSPIGFTYGFEPPF